MRLFYLLPLLLLTALGSVHAQTPMKREIGLRSNLDDPLNAGFIYKKQLAENRYRRYRLGFANATVNVQSPYPSNRFSLGTAIGTEFRKTLDDRLQFIHGPEVSLSFSIASAGGFNSTTPEQYTLFSPNLGFGYVLGVQYNFSDKWYVNLETIPSISVSTTYGAPIDTPVYVISAGFSSHSVGLTGAYRF